MPDPVVHCIIPVRNRAGATAGVLALLRQQSFPQLRVVVVDDGSTDETPRILESAKQHLALNVLRGDGTLWWGGATALAIASISQSCGDSDFVLLLNDDTTFESSFVWKLVTASQRHGRCVVGAVTRSSEDNSLIGTGFKISYWRATIEPYDLGQDDAWVDALPGRGLLIPIEAVRRAGTVDSNRFPHYMGDIEYTARIRECGFPLLITHDTCIQTSSTPSDAVALASGARSRRLSLKSKSRALDRIRFFHTRGPRYLRSTGALRWMLLGFIRHSIAAAARALPHSAAREGKTGR